MTPPTPDRDDDHGLGTQVGPHEFNPISILDRVGINGRCKSCYFPRWVHPNSVWSIARPINDYSVKRTSLRDAMEIERRHKQEIQA